jgi:hypothetical protein
MLDRCVEQRLRDPSVSRGRVDDEADDRPSPVVVFFAGPVVLRPLEMSQVRAGRDGDPADRNAVLVCEEARLAAFLDERSHPAPVRLAAAAALPPPHAPAVLTSAAAAARSAPREEVDEVVPTVRSDGMDLHHAENSVFEARSRKRESAASRTSALGSLNAYSSASMAFVAWSG